MFLGSKTFQGRNVANNKLYKGEKPPALHGEFLDEFKGLASTISKKGIGPLASKKYASAKIKHHPSRVKGIG